MSKSDKVAGLVSVILPAYNAEKYIGEAIESILNQTYKNFELIIIEDCSTDKTADIVAKYAKQDSRIKAIYKRQNNGVIGFIKNLNEGIDLSKGEFIARMDADDISLPDRFQQQVNYLHVFKDVLLVGSGAIGINEEGNEVGRVIPVPDASKLLPFKDVIMHPTVMLRNDFEERYRLLFCEDYDLWLQFLKNGKQLHNLPQPLIKYRILKTSLTNKSIIKTYAASILAQRIYQGIIKYEQADSNAYYEEIVCGKASRKDYSDLLKLGARIPSLELITELNGVIPFWDIRAVGLSLQFLLQARRAGGDMRRLLLKR